MSGSVRLSLVIPVLNEEAAIADFLDESGKAVEKALALIGDDARMANVEVHRRAEPQRWPGR